MDVFADMCLVRAVQYNTEFTNIMPHRSSVSGDMITINPDRVIINSTDICVTATIIITKR